MTIKQIVCSVPSCFLKKLIAELYLPEDTSADWAYQFADILSLACVAFLLVKSHSSSFKRRGLTEASGWLVCLLPCLVLAYFTHPCHNENSWGDVVWMTAVYLEVVVTLPQLLVTRRLASLDDGC
eukprot:gene2-21_t